MSAEEQDCPVSGDETSHSLLRRILLTAAPQVDESATHDAEEEECLSEEEEEDVQVEDISEQELLAMLDAEEDSLFVCRRLFKDRPQNEWQLRCLTAHHVQQLKETGVVVIDDLLNQEVVDQVRQEALKMVGEGKLKPPHEQRKNEDPFRDQTARNDLICWLHLSDIKYPLSEVACLLQTLQADVAEVFHLVGQAEYQLACYPGNGARYEKHRDAFPTDDPSDEEQRRVTMIVYFTEKDWQETDGGLLRIHHRLPSSAEVVGRKMNLSADKPQRRSGDDHDHGDGDGTATATDDDDDDATTAPPPPPPPPLSSCGGDILPVSGRVVIFLSGAIDHEVRPAFRQRIAITCWCT